MIFARLVGQVALPIISAKKRPEIPARMNPRASEAIKTIGAMIFAFRNGMPHCRRLAWSMVARKYSGSTKALTIKPKDTTHGRYLDTNSKGQGPSLMWLAKIKRALSYGLLANV